MQQKKLNSQTWLQAAFRALTSGGPAAIKVEVIARDLNVSKGSFYWHFKNVPALKSQMLTHWKDTATQAVIKDLEKTAASPAEKLKNLIIAATSGRDDKYGGVLAEAAIRDWARYDPEVSATVKQIDSKRLDFLKVLFLEYGFNDENSISHARLIYASLIGLQALSHHDLANSNKELLNLLSILLKTKGQDPLHGQLT